MTVDCSAERRCYLINAATFIFLFMFVLFLKRKLSVMVHKLTALGNTWEHRLPGLKDPTRSSCPYICLTVIEPTWVFIGNTQRVRAICKSKFCWEKITKKGKCLIWKLNVCNMMYIIKHGIHTVHNTSQKRSVRQLLTLNCKVAVI